LTCSTWTYAANWRRRPVTRARCGTIKCMVEIGAGPKSSSQTQPGLHLRTRGSGGNYLRRRRRLPPICLPNKAPMANFAKLAGRPDDRRGCFGSANPALRSITSAGHDLTVLTNQGRSHESEGLGGGGGGAARRDEVADCRRPLWNGRPASAASVGWSPLASCEMNPNLKAPSGIHPSAVGKEP